MPQFSYLRKKDFYNVSGAVYFIVKAGKTSTNCRKKFTFIFKFSNIKYENAKKTFYFTSNLF